MTNFGPRCPALHPDLPYSRCWRDDGHSGAHRNVSGDGWGEPVDYADGGVTCAAIEKEAEKPVPLPEAVMRRLTRERDDARTMAKLWKETTREHIGRAEVYQEWMYAAQNKAERHDCIRDAAVIEKTRDLTPEQEDQVRLGEIVRDVQNGDGWGVEIGGVKIAQCDTYGRTEDERAAMALTADDITEQARAEAEERFPPPKESAVIYPLTAVRSHSRGAFIAGVEWARDHLAAQEPTDAEVEAAAIMLCASAHHERVWKALAEVDPWKQEQIRADARAALSAARSVGRDAR